jgi:rod shape determining protein RodA
MNRQICFGIAGMLLFQIFINVGVCLGILPVIGLTLPFLSYGGSSIVTMFMAMGIVSGIHMRPAPDANARYIRLSPIEGTL